jgi:acyl dehydratase
MTRIVVERALTQSDFDAFADLSGDDNPIHVDAAYAARTRFGRTVSHGVLLLSVLRALAAQLTPGLRQIRQEAMYPAPTFADEPMRFEAEIVDEKGGVIEVAFSVTRIADGTMTCAARGWFTP